MTAAIRELSKHDILDHVPELAQVLHACVTDGASVGFVMPFTLQDAQRWYENAVVPGIGHGRILWGAFDRDRLVGTVQLVLADMPNQTHRAEVSKMLVHPEWRRRGIARALMDILLKRAEEEGRCLVTLDTRSGDPSQALYASCGFAVAGEIPGYALAPDGSGGQDATTYMYRATT